MSIRNHVAAILAGTAALTAAGFAQADTLPVASGHAFYFSGSTAMDNPLKALFLDNNSGGVCASEAGGVDVYSDAALQPAAKDTLTKGHNTTVVCKLRTTIGSLAAGQVVALDKESNGGSLEGAIPVARGTGLAFINGTGSAPTCTGTTTVAAGLNYSTQQAYTLHYGCATTAGIVPHIGVADENLEVFNIGSPSITPSDIAALNVNQFAQNIFGVALSLKGYRSLQTSQGLTADDTIAHMPSLSTAQIRALYTGQVTNWSGITDSSGGSLPAGQVYVCRRGDSSGTNTSMDIRFIGDRCVSSSVSSTQTMIPVTTTAAHCGGSIGTPEEYGCAWNATNNGADTVFAGFGGGDVASCLNFHDTQNQIAIGNLTTNQAFDDVNGAGGSADTTGTNHFRFVRIDGHSPDAGNVVNGGYDFVFDNVLTYKKTAAAEVASLANVLLTDWTSSGALVGSLLTTQVGDANFTAGALEDQLNPLGSASPNTTPAYVTGAAVKSGTGGVTPVTPWTFFAVNSNVPQDCAPATALPNTGLPAIL